MVRITIHNEVNQSDKHIGFGFRKNDPITSDVIWNVFDKVSQYKSRFNDLDTLNIVVHSVKIPVDF